MVFDYEHPDRPFDYWETQAATPRPARVLAPLPMVAEGTVLHIKVRANGPLFKRRKPRRAWDT
jgi:hypothetical protein